ncbi:hypothetical protein DRE_04018 [Drechslerella stenobrocha 248]|uniref:Nucleoporin Nup159/Nup146 N-terminal domain-containing protein n=1 Tax=Drechslerella stenobrocha 248 TaxID=1043628 RepID=W7I3J8_9PEZI|nr:hypothetical protein DRE_04018 [Drechslerella stenobrocha 248]
MSFGQPSQFGVLNSAQSAPSGAFSRSSSIAAASVPAEVLLGDEVQESESDAIGYLALAGELKVKVFEGRYPENDLPIPSSHLLSISQKRQLFAAGGPQGVVVARTSTLRATFKNKSVTNGNILPFQPECVIPMSIRLSHVAFTSDGAYLLLGAQLGGIAVYSVDDILSKGNGVQPQSQITTGPLLEMKPIPTVAGAEKVCILVGSGWSQGGAVGIVDVKTQQVQGNLKTGVTTVCWSPKGKQIICGGSGGGLAWIKPDGVEADVVPGVPNHPTYFVSSIYWIESEIIFVIITPKLQAGSQEHDNESVHFVLIREGKKHTFYRVNDMSPPFGMSSRPTYHSFIHLKGWAPNMKDCLVLSNTCSTDIGTLLRLSNTPFTPTSILSDGRRATLPLTTDGGDMTPIGLALDLTTTDAERVDNPYPNIESSSTALPCMWILTNEGIISAYWVVYSDAIKVGDSSAAYPELLAYEGQQPPQTPQRATAPGFGHSGFGGQNSTASFASQSSAFGTPKPAFGQPSTPTSSFGQPAKPATGFGQQPAQAFGQPSQPTSTFAQPSTSTSAFGQSASTVFGQPSKPASTFGRPSTLQPAFGQSSAPQSAFGQASTSQPAFGQTSAPQSSFGQPAFGSTTTLGRPGMSINSLTSGTGGNSGSAFGSSSFGAQAPASGFSQSFSAPAFGSTSALGGSGPAFGSSTPLGAGRPALGQSGFASSQAAGSGFGQTSQLGSKLPAFGSGAASGSSGFAKFSSGGGFLAAASNSNAPPAFLQSGGSNDPFASKQSDTFASLKNGASESAFGANSAGGFSITSAFGSTTGSDSNKPIGSTAPAAGAFGSAFGSSLGTALSQPAASANIKDDEMQDSDEEVEQPRAGVRGGNMFDVSSTLRENASATPAKDASKTLASAFGQTPQAEQSVAGTTKSSFGTGLFGSAVNKEQPKGAFGATGGAGQPKGAFGSVVNNEQPKGAFGSPAKPPALAPAFGSQDTKSGAAVGAFGPLKTPETPSANVGSGLFGSALQKSASASQPASAFGKSASQSSAFSTTSSTAAKTTAPAFGQKLATPVASADLPEAKVELGTAASKTLPDDNLDDETVESSQVEEAPFPPDFVTGAKKPAPAVSKIPLPTNPASKKEAPAVPSALKTPLPESARAKDLSTTVSSSSAPKTASPSKADSSNEPPSPQTQIKPPATRAANPLAARKGGARPTLNSLKTSGSRVPPQKAGTAAKHGKALAEGDNDADDASGFTFMPKIEKGGPALNKGGSVFDNIGASSARPINFSAAAAAAAALPEDDSDSDSDDVSNADSDDASEEGSPVDDNRAADGPSDRSSELGDEGWVKTGDTGDEESPVQPSLPLFEATTTSTRAASKSLFNRVDPTPSKEPGVSTPKQQLNKPTGTLKEGMRTSKAEPKSPKKPSAQKVQSSPREVARKQQQEDDRRRAELERRRVEQERQFAEQESMRKARIVADAQAHIELLRQQMAAEAAEINANERQMRENEDKQRELLKEPFEPSSTLKQLIPYRENGPFTHFKGHNAIMEHLAIAIERRIDNFGMNMRNVESFVAYNRGSDHFTLDDKRPAEEIRVTAAPDLSLMAKDLTEKTHELNKVLDLDALKAIVMSLISDVDYLCARASDIPNIILLYSHPELRAHIRKRPLAAQQRMQQSSLRKKVPLLRRRFKRADDEFRVLQARVATLNKIQKANYGDIRPPTIEQVRETVARLTDVAKEKADRLENLEDALRKMRIRSVSPVISRGTTPNFRAGSVSFSASGRGDRDRLGSSTTRDWKASRRGKDAPFATPPRNMPGPDKFDYYENTVDSPMLRAAGSKQNPRKTPKKTPGMFGLIEEELGDEDYFHENNIPSSNNVPIGTSYDRGMAELRKEILITPKKGEATGEVPNTPASRQVNRLLRGEMEEISGGKGARQAWADADDYAEDKKLKREIGRRMAKVIRKVGVKKTVVEVSSAV